MSDDTTGEAPGEPTPPVPRAKRDPALRAAVKSVALTGLVLAVGAAAFSGAQTGVGVAIGGVLATVNLVLFIRIGEAFLAQGTRPSWAALGFIKLLALFACVYLILRRGDVSALALVVGYGALPIGITVSGLMTPREK